MRMIILILFYFYSLKYLAYNIGISNRRDWIFFAEFFSDHF